MNRPTILTAAVMSRIAAMVEQGMSAEDIARELGCTVGTLRVRCSNRGISLRRRREPRQPPPPQIRLPEIIQLHLRPSTMMQLRQWADMRGVTPHNLATALLETIANDRLCDAVLDTE